jgi:membrane-associated phospholipid phosphatase
MLEQIGWWVTTFGNYEVLLGIAVGYGVVARRGDLTPALLVIGAVTLVTFLKSLFAVPRPPGASIGGYAMPSGHATVSVVAYGTIGALEDRGIGYRTVIAGVIAVLIALSRVVIGVHYPADVFVGLALGTTYLVVGLRLQCYLLNCATQMYRTANAPDQLPLLSND